MPVIETFNIGEIKNNNYLWKYVSIEKFLSFVIHKKLHFTRIDCFEDKLEGADPKLLFLYNQRKELEKLLPNNELNTQKIDYHPVETDELVDKLRDTQKFNFANCWFLSCNSIESVAMWNLYSQPNSVTLKINYNEFFDVFSNRGFELNHELKKLVLGCVKYVDFQDPYEIRDLLDKINITPFIKDISFCHENEFRIIAEIEKYKIPPLELKEGSSRYRQEESHNKKYNIYSLDLFLNNFNDYSFEIIFHPKMKDWVKDIICKILEQFKIKFECKNSCLML